MMTTIIAVSTTPAITVAGRDCSIEAMFAPNYYTSAPGYPGAR
jgi:hypothetical protein